MLKKLLYLFVGLTFGFTTINAQTSNYTYSQSVGTYTPITGGTLLGNATSDDQRFVDPATPLGGTVLTGPGFPIGFNFTYNGIVFDRLAVNNNGWLSLGQSSLTPSVDITSSSSYTPLASIAANTPALLRNRIAGFARDLVATATSELRIETTGTAPNRVCIVQWKDYIRFSATGSGLGDNLNFQIRLTETSNTVQTVYGSFTFGATVSANTHVGLSGLDSSDHNNRTSTTDWNATTTSAASNVGVSVGSTVTIPANGRTFTWAPPVVVACTGTPTPGNTLSTVTNACVGVNFTLSLQNASTATGLTYQWQSASALAGPWTTIGGSTPTLARTQTDTTYYRCNVTCGGNTGTSTPVKVGMNNFINCYCTAGATTADELISNVTFGSINNSSTATAGYENFSAISTQLARTSITPIRVTVAPAYTTDQVIVFIDFNQNGSFADAGETVFSSANGGPFTGNITVPATAVLGNTKMRVRLHDTGGAPSNATSCGLSQYGQVEDYGITIITCAPGVITTQPVNSSTSCGGSATFTMGATGTGITYLWQERTSATAAWTNVTNGANYGGATTGTLTVSNVPISNNGYQYRCVLNGICTVIDFSSVATLTVNALVAAVTPSAATICTGSIQALNITTGAQLTSSFASGPLSLAIPETNAGINNSIPVSLPAGAFISEIKVKINAPHTYASDLFIVLKSPNGKILNLSNLVSGTNQSGANFVNTIFSSSAGLPAISTGVRPGYTGTFKPDAVLAGAFGLDAGPSGYLPNTTLFTDLFSSPNGNWTIAMYDAGPPDVGTLTSWSLDISYSFPFAGVWSPTTGLYTDAAATIPYTGTALSTVYAKPTATTNYSVVITTALCTSTATVIPVTVNTPITTLSAPVATSICTNGNTSFTVAAAAGNPVTYQWQEKTTPNGAWVNIANAGVYTGATTSKLNLTSVPVTYDGYRYRTIATVASCGSKTSDTAILSVKPLPVIAINVAPYKNILPGLTTTVSATPSAGAFTWYKDGSIVSGANTGSYVVNVDRLGTYTATATDAAGCTSLISNSVTISDSISDKVYIYPNPNKGIFQVRYYSLKGNTNLPRGLVVYDAKGMEVLRQSYSIGRPYQSMDVNIERHGKGVYWVELVDVNGNRLKMNRIVVQ
jgi:subtilisin-like proprotein convertase family protein